MKKHVLFPSTVHSVERLRFLVNAGKLEAGL
jgi:hypothetical protein